MRYKTSSNQNHWSSFVFVGHALIFICFCLLWTDVLTVYVDAYIKCIWVCFDDTIHVELLDSIKFGKINKQKKWFFVTFFYTKYVRRQHLHHKEIEAVVNMNTGSVCVWEREREHTREKITILASPSESTLVEESWSRQPCTTARDELDLPDAMGLD